MPNKNNHRAALVNDTPITTDWLAVGARLRESREAQALQPAAIAGKLCLSPRQILAIEAGETRPFPSDTTRVWCVRRYAALLGLDWVAVVGAPPEAVAAVAEVMPVPAVEPAPARPPRSGAARKAAGILIVGGALGLAAGFFLHHPTASRSAAEEPVAERPAADAVVADAPPPAVPAEAVVDARSAPGEVEEIRGADPTRPANAVFVRSDQTVVVHKRQRDGAAESRLELAAGNASRVPVAPDELLRVEGASDTRVFYQGRQVPREVLERGAWLLLTPN